MAMRYTTELLAIGIALGAAGWFARAPAQPDARAAYLCRPVGTFTRVLGALEAAFSDADQVIPPRHAWLPDLPRDCERLVLRLADPDEEP
jgi:hypothetical protein